MLLTKLTSRLIRQLRSDGRMSGFLKVRHHMTFTTPVFIQRVLCSLEDYVLPIDLVTSGHFCLYHVVTNTPERR